MHSVRLAARAIARAGSMADGRSREYISVERLLSTSLRFELRLSLSRGSSIPLSFLARLAVVSLFSLALWLLTIFSSPGDFGSIASFPSIKRPVPEVSKYSIRNASIHSPPTLRFSCPRSPPSSPRSHSHRQRPRLLHLQSQRRQPHQARLSLYLLQRIRRQVPGHEPMGKLQRSMGISSQKRLSSHRRHQPRDPSYATSHCLCQRDSPSRPQSHPGSHSAREQR